MKERQLQQAGIIKARNIRTKKGIKIVERNTRLQKEVNDVYSLRK